VKRIKQSYVMSSSAFSVPRKCIRQFRFIPEHKPQIGDLVYGEVSKLGFHTTLESTSARIHTIHERSRAVFTFGNRYATDFYEGMIPTNSIEYADMVARSGVIGKVTHQSELISAPTQIRILGYICDDDGKVINSRNHVLIKPKDKPKDKPRAKIILCIGSTMNSGKSFTAAACSYALSSMGKKVRAAKVTGTASLKDILLMQDSGAQHVLDFTYFGYPSTYMLEMDELLALFTRIDNKYGLNPKNYLVMEFADGILQRETAMLLNNPYVKERIHKLIFCASDACGVSGGLRILKESYDLVPDAISGLCSSSYLAIREIKSFTDIEVLRSMKRDFKEICNLIA